MWCHLTPRAWIWPTRTPELNRSTYTTWKREKKRKERKKQTTSLKKGFFFFLKKKGIAEPPRDYTIRVCEFECSNIFMISLFFFARVLYKGGMYRIEWARLMDIGEESSTRLTGNLLGFRCRRGGLCHFFFSTSFSFLSFSLRQDNKNLTIRVNWGPPLCVFSCWNLRGWKWTPRSAICTYVGRYVCTLSMQCRAFRPTI